MKIQEKSWWLRLPVSSSGDGEKQLDSRLTWKIELMGFPEEYLQDSVLNVFFFSLKVYLQITYLLIKSTLSRYNFHVIQCILLSVQSWQVRTHVTTGTIKTWNISIKSKSPLHSASLPPPAPGNHKSAFCHDRLVLSRLSCSWNHTVCTLVSGLIHWEFFDIHPCCVYEQSATFYW